MDNETKKTIRDDGSITPSGVTPSGTGTQKDTQPVISSGIAPGTPPSQIISSGMSTPGSKIVLNDENYKILKVIAKSTGEAEIYLAEKENQKYVFKYYFPNFKPKDSLLKQLKGLHHDDIVGLIDYGYYKDRFFEILEYAEGGILMEIQEDGKYKYIPLKDINRIRQIVKETVNALHWCHSKGIIHRDLKPENIFFKNPDGTDILIGDFGISSMLDEGLSKHMTGQARTEIYAAPELYQSIGGKTIISKEVDYYALGITLIFVWQAKDPFEELSPHAIMRIKLEGKVYIPEEMPEELKNLIKGLITVEPSKRWGYEEVQKWLKGEYVPVYYRVVETKYPDFHFGAIGGEDIVINDPEELAKVLEKYPEQGKKHLYKGTIQRWVENVDQSLYVETRGIVEDDYPQDQDAGLIKAIYLLDPIRKYRTFSGVECGNAQEIGEALEQESSYYKPLLTQQKNNDLFLFLEARGARNEADTFRKYAQTFNLERAFNTIVLELQGKDQFKFSGQIFAAPEDLLSADEALREKMVDSLKNPDSKLSLWLEGYPHLEDNIEKWRRLKRYNTITLVFALDERSPFTAINEKIYNLAQFKDFFARHITDRDLLPEMTTYQSYFTAEADFWLENYQKSSYDKVAFSFLKGNMNALKKNVYIKLCEYLINATPASDYKKRKEIAEYYLEKEDPSHQLVQRFKKEDLLFITLKREKLNELEIEREDRIKKVSDNFEKKLDGYKETERDRAHTAFQSSGTKKFSGCLGMVIGGFLGFVFGANTNTISGMFFGPIIGAFIGSVVSNLIAQSISGNVAKSKVTLSSYEQTDKNKQVDDILNNVQQRIDLLDEEIRNTIAQMTDEELSWQLASH